MLQSRKEDYDEQEDELLEEDVVGAGSGDDDIENLSLAERRALLKARRQESRDAAKTSKVADEIVGSAVTSSKEERGIKTRSRDAAEQERQRQVQGRAENVPVMGGIVSYFRGVRAEILKVTWPTREEAWRLTRIVAIVTTIFAIVLGAVDFLYGSWFSASIEETSKFIYGLIPFLIAATALSYVVFIQSAE